MFVFKIISFLDSFFFLWVIVSACCFLEEIPEGQCLAVYSIFYEKLLCRTKNDIIWLTRMAKTKGISSSFRAAEGNSSPLFSEVWIFATHQLLKSQLCLCIHFSVLRGLVGRSGLEGSYLTIFLYARSDYYVDKWDYVSPVSAIISAHSRVPSYRRASLNLVT